MTQTHTITAVLEEYKYTLKVQTNLTQGDTFLWVKRKHISCQNNSTSLVGGTFEKDTPVILDDFWKDVVSRSGMDVCTPFINRFPNHSFVAYDGAGCPFVWSKTMQAAFILENGKTPAFGVIPKACKKVYRLGDSL